MSGQVTSIRWRARRAAGCAALSLALASPLASAQVSNNKAAAEALFDQGVSLLKEGKYRKACEKLESSQRIDPGIGTLLYLGDCYERLGRTASAWATFREAASKAKAAGEMDRARVGSQRADALESKLARVTIQMANANMSIPGLQVTETGREMNRALWGSAVPVDPGDLKVVVKAEGYEPFEATISIEPGTSDNLLEIPALIALPEEAKPAKQGGTGETAQPEDQAPSSGAWRTVGFAVGGAGVVGLGVGGVFGILALNQNKTAKEHCDVSTLLCEEKHGLTAARKAYDYSVVSTTGFIVGGVLLATGVVLVLTSPKKKKTASIESIEVTPTLGGAQFSLGGSF